MSLSDNIIYLIDRCGALARIPRISESGIVYTYTENICKSLAVMCQYRTEYVHVELLLNVLNVDALIAFCCDLLVKNRRLKNVHSNITNLKSLVHALSLIKDAG